MLRLPRNARRKAQFNPGVPRWIAYDFDDSGRREIYVQAFEPGQECLLCAVANFKRRRFNAPPPLLRSPSFEYDVTPDGQRFLLIEPAEKPEYLPLTLVSNWLTK